VSISDDERQALETLESRVRTILPPEYQDSYEEVQPVPMRSAGLKFRSDGRVAWDDMWESFCDLAMAGGPPHKGTLLEPAARAAIEAQPDRYALVTAEICRGIEMVASLPADPASDPGWIRVECLNATMAGWLTRAIVMENVAAYAQGQVLHLPAGPEYRLEKEIKNVVTVIAKTSHYWLDHTLLVQQRAIAALFAQLEQELPLVAPTIASDDGDGARVAQARVRIAGEWQKRSGLGAASHRYAGWIGVMCPSVRAAIWMMRALVATNVLARREGTDLFLPINPASDPDGSHVAAALSRVHGFAVAKAVF
jgi:sirohydrochlorin cobaltochelatase